MPTFEASSEARIFSEIPDARKLNSCDHKLGDILCIALCTTLCDHTEFTEMEAWGQLNEGWLRSFLELPNGIPSHDTFRRVIGRLEPGLFLDAFIKFPRFGGHRWVRLQREKSNDKEPAHL